MRNDFAPCVFAEWKFNGAILAGNFGLIEITARDGAITFAVRVVPRSSRDAIDGDYNGALKIRVIAPALENRANEALARLLADSLNVPLSAVRIIAGEKSRTKRVAVVGVTRDQIAALAASRRK